MLNMDSEIHKPLREVVYDELKRRILVGEIEPGTRMMEVELAEDMGVSRTPVREAIRKLEKEGLVTIEPRRGAYASDISIKDVIDVLEVRQGVDGMAAAFASGKLTEEQHEELQKVLEDYRRAVENEDIEQMIKNDEKFHSLIVKYSGNKTLMRIFSTVQELALRFRYIYYDDFNRYEDMPMEHQQIEEAIYSGDRQAANLAAGEHVLRLKEFVENEGESVFHGTKK